MYMMMMRKILFEWWKLSVNKDEKNDENLNFSWIFEYFFYLFCSENSSSLVLSSSSAMEIFSI